MVDGALGVIGVVDSGCRGGSVMQGRRARVLVEQQPQ